MPSRHTHRVMLMGFKQYLIRFSLLFMMLYHGAIFIIMSILFKIQLPSTCNELIFFMIGMIIYHTITFLSSGYKFYLYKQYIDGHTSQFFVHWLSEHHICYQMIEYLLNIYGAIILIISIVILNVDCTDSAPYIRLVILIALISGGVIYGLWILFSILELVGRTNLIESFGGGCCECFSTDSTDDFPTNFQRTSSSMGTTNSISQSGGPTTHPAPHINYGSVPDSASNACSICLDEESGLFIQLPCKGKHVFHKNCVHPWVVAHGSCPLCRGTVCESV
jgi:hypothetical protein